MIIASKIVPYVFSLSYDKSRSLYVIKASFVPPKKQSNVSIPCREVSVSLTREVAFRIMLELRDSWTPHNTQTNKGE